MNTSLDGGGVFPEHPLGDDVHVRFRPDDDRMHDVIAYVEDGVLHVAGMWATLVVRQTEPHRITVHAVVPRREAR